MSDNGYSSDRQRVANDLGTEFAAKASDAFCAYYAEPAMRGPGDRPVLELRATPADLAVPDDFQPPLDVPPEPRRAVRMRGGPPPPPQGGAGPVPSLQELDPRVAEARRRALWAMRPLVDELRRGSERRRMRGGPAPLPPSQVCWLNRTVRTGAQPAALAPFVEDPLVRHVDITRTLVADGIRATGRVVGGDWARETFACTGNKVRVGVIDTEVAADHPALLGRVIHRRNFTNELWGVPSDHGTSIAGIIAAQCDEQGIAPDVVIYNYKVLGSTSVRDADDFDLACALEWALMDKVRIANVSLGTRAKTDGSSREVEACNAAWALGMTIVKSAGNFGAEPGTVTCPADAAGVIVVGATDREGRGVQPYSGRGPALNQKPCPDLVAPGGTDYETLESTRADGSFGCCKYGTSLAAPHVTGLLALLLGAKPWLSPGEQRAELLKRCVPLSGDENDQGAGLVCWSDETRAARAAA